MVDVTEDQIFKQYIEWRGQEFVMQIDFAQYEIFCDIM